MSMKYFFSLCLSVSSHHLCLHLSLGSFTHVIAHQSRSAFLCSCTRLIIIAIIIMFCVLFSVSELFVPFSVSFSLCWDRVFEAGRQRLSGLCG